MVWYRTYVGISVGGSVGRGVGGGVGGGGVGVSETVVMVSGGTDGGVGIPRIS